MSKVWVLLICFLIIIGCRQKKDNDGTIANINKENLEAREDSMELVASYKSQSKIESFIHAVVETNPIKAGNNDDAADDPAIWVNPVDPSKSLIYGSNKKGGLAVFNLEGKEVAYYPIGKINNVDIIYDIPFGSEKITVLGCSNRSTQSIELFVIKADGTLENIAAKKLIVDASLIDDIYGFCFAKDLKSNISYCIINGKNGLLQQFEIKEVESGLDLSIERTIQFDSQTEGMVADNKLGFIYVGEEGRGIWKLNILPSKGNEKIFIKDSDQTNPNIEYDIEGISLYENGEEGYIIASSQGNFSYAVFSRNGNNEYLGSFKVIDNIVDGVEETDGLDIVSDSLNSQFPNGLVVMQDGFNFEKNVLVPQNFKYISWKDLNKIIIEFE